MLQHIDKNLTIADLAKQQQFSVSYYTKLFRKKAGKAPVAYFNQLKIQKACQHLYFTDNSVKQIAATLGFRDAYYFSRAFRKLAGLSPAFYRKAHRK